MRANMTDRLTMRNLEILEALTEGTNLTAMQATMKTKLRARLKAMVRDLMKAARETMYLRKQVTELERELAATTEAMLAERAAKEEMAAMVQDPLTYMTVGEKVATPELMDTLATAREIRLMAQEVMDALVLMAVRAQTDDNAPGS